VPIPRPLSRVLLGGALVGGGALAVVGGLAVRGPGLIGIGLAATLAGCTAAGIAREKPAPARVPTLEAAVRAAGGTVGVLLVVAGLSTVAGGIVATLVVTAAVVVVGVRILRRPGPLGATGATTKDRGRPAAAEVLRLPVSPPPRAVGLPPVSTMTTRALGHEWLRTTAALGSRLTSAARASLVVRRESVLDELESRDPAGFARWLAAGPAGGSDPADYVRGGPAHRGPVRDTDAA
jgi:hypothetical protein